MTQIENLSLSQRLTICVDKKSQLDLFEKVHTTISNGGLPEEVLGKIADLPIHGVSVRKIVQLNIDEGNLKENDGLIVPTKKVPVRYLSDLTGPHEISEGLSLRGR